MAKTRLKISPTGDVEVSVYSLKTDSWQDYQAFLADARKAETANDLRARNRFLRAGLMNLFAHFDAFLVEVYNSQGLSSAEPVTLHTRFAAISELIRKQGQKIPSVRLELAKALRDIVAHPAIEVYNPFGRSFDQVKVYESLSIEALTYLGGQIAWWCKTVSKHTGHLRLSNTRKMAKTLSTAIGEADSIREF